MKLQTSLEFLLILSAVAALSLGVLSLYGKTFSFERQVLSAFAPANITAGSAAQQYAQIPGIAINVPVNSTAMSGNPLMVEAYGCSTGIEKIAMSASNITFSQPSLLTNFTGFELKYFYFDPETPGVHSINLSYSIACNKTIISGRHSYLTYSSQKYSSVGSSGTTTASIRYLNESILYPVQRAGIDYLYRFSLCTQRDIWSGYVYPSSVQCGTANSWDHMTFDGSCEAPDWSYSRTYCFVPQSSGYNAIIPETENASYAYAISVSINSGYGLMSFNLSSSNHSSPVILNGMREGNAIVENVTSSAFSPPLLLEGPDSSIYKGSAYSYYSSAESTAYQVLHFYNSTGVSSSTSSSIQEAVAAANSGEKSLLGNLVPQSSASCKYALQYYVCKSKYPFYYVVNVTIYNTSMSGSLAVPYYGSVINILYR